MKTNTLIAVGSWTCRLLAALQIGAAGVGKFVTTAWSMRFAGYGYAEWFMKVIAVLEIVGVVLLLIPRTMAAGALVLAAVLIGAVYTQVLHGETMQIARPLLPLALLMLALWLRRVSRLKSNAASTG